MGTLTLATFRHQLSIKKNTSLANVNKDRLKIYLKNCSLADIDSYLILNLECGQSPKGLFTNF